MKKITLLAALIVSGLYSFAQKHTISGYVTDAQSGEKLISARVFDPDRKLGSITNSYGFYSITTEDGLVAVNCSYVGFKPFNTAFELKADTTLNITMEPEGVQLDAVEITDTKDIAENTQMSTIDMPVEMIKKIPALMGEVDVIKALQLLPGVQSGGEGSTGFYVRGGGPDQNLILLDGTPVYNVSHLFGFFSVFPADAISNVSLLKGGFPARYGGRLSSVIDISLKDGNNKKIHGEGSVGIIATKLTLEGPIIKDKTTFMISARRTYIDLLTQPFIKLATKGTGSAGYYFYDMVGKVSHKFSDKDRLYLSFYGGNDRAYFNEKYEDNVPPTSYESQNKFDLAWGNKIVAARWNHLFGPKLFGNFMGTLSTFKFGVGNEYYDKQVTNGVKEESKFGFKYDSGIRDWSAKADFDWFASPGHLVRFGGYGINHKFTPGVSRLTMETSGINIDTILGSNVIRAWETGAYIEDDFKLGSRQKFNLGLHGSAFFVDGKHYTSLQPRVAYRLMIDSHWAFKASYTHMYQYIHLLTNSNVGLPTDLWVPSTGSVKPQSADQGAVGIARSFDKAGLEVSVEGYYKYMTGLVEYKEGASYFSENTDWQSKIAMGHGWAYGGEFFLQKKYGKTTGWIGYTLSWNKRQFDDLNFGKVFPFKYDRRHDVSFVVTHEFSKKIDCGLVWVYGTGNATTMPVGSYQSFYPSPSQQFGYPYNVDQVGPRNGYRMRAYHRLDLSINFNKDFKKWSRTWSFSVYNAYSRRNPYFLYFDYDNIQNKRVLKQVSLFPIIPSVAYRFKF
jgi:hypothetical protein